MKRVTCLGCLREFTSAAHLERHLAGGTYALWKRALYSRREWAKQNGLQLRRRLGRAA